MAKRARQISPRILAARENGRRGGLARAKKLSAEQRSAIAKLGGDKTLANHGVGFFKEVVKLRKTVGRRTLALV